MLFRITDKKLRYFSFIIDFLLAMFIIVVVGEIYCYFAKTAEPSDNLLLVLFIVIFAIKDISGNSIGKRLLGFAVFSTVTNEKPTIIQLILRNMFFFFLLPFEAIMILFRPDQRRFGDMIAKTKVEKIYK